MLAPVDARQAQAEAAAPGTLDELNVETRLLLTFALPDAALAGFLPAGWQSNPAPQGPAKDANLLLVLADRLIVQDASSAPLPGQSPNQLAVVAIPAKSEHGAGLVIAYGLSAEAGGAPGPYRVFAPATFTLDRRSRNGGQNCEESWNVAGADGEKISLSTRYRRGPVLRSSTETRAYSGADPSFCRIYLADQGADPLQLGGTPGERLDSFELTCEGPRLSQLSDRSTRLLSVISVPWTVRRAFLAGA